MRRGATSGRRGTSRRGDSWRGAWSVPQGDGEEEAARRRIRAEVDVARHGLLSVVADFRVVAGVVGDDEQVAAGERELRAPTAEAVPDRARQIESDAQLAQLHEGRALDEGARVAVVARLVARLSLRRVAVGREVVAVVEREGL